ncbi:MAG: UDP-N-acetylmuramate dehydrogenase, partial [Gammaproteobacteria bacterium]|nr:UDP-N-acetylmuramate dehydrogenase [Gammaproteobacteria bacterium]
FFKPADLQDLAAFLRSLPKGEPLYWVGLGSNLLVRDGGIRGTVIYTTGLLAQMNIVGDNMLRVEAGVPCAKVARFGTHNDLIGAEFLAGIPGTMGGALAMNAGAFGGETWAIVRQVEMMNRQGKIVTRTPEEFEVGYRHVSGRDDEWFVAATLQLTPGDGEAAKQRIKALLAKRGATQPTKLPSCGSVFRNPPGDYAARLIEAAGLKGIGRGGACVSEKHANFIVNMGGATAEEIETLLFWVQSQVEKQYGVKLVPEVKIIGDALDAERVDG